MLLSYSWQWHMNWAPIVIGLIALVVIAYFLLFPILVAKAARNRGRSGTLWFLLSLLISPILTVLLLLAMGDTDAKRREKWQKEEHIRNSMPSHYPNTSSHEDNNHLKQLLEKSRHS